MADSTITDVGKGLEYFKKKKQGQEPLMDQMERALGEEPSSPQTPLPTIPPKKKLMDNSTEGSPAFSKSELKQGYRKVR